MEFIVLVDEADNEIGAMEKLQAHVEGKLHRAISVFIFNSKKELLLQQRASGKYHSPLLWTNTTCSHPRVGESPIDAANRRLKEEMGMSCELNKAFSFIYKAVLDNNLIEHEYDHVFIGTSDTTPVINKDEVENWRYISVSELAIEINEKPGQFTEWFKICWNDYNNLLFNN